MKKNTLRIIFIFGVCILLNTSMTPAQTLSPEAEAALKEYAIFEADVMKKAETEMSLRWEKLLTDLQTLQADLTKAGNLDGALAVRDRMNALKNDRTAKYTTVLPDPGDLKGFKNFKPRDTLLFKVKGNTNQRGIWGTDLYTLDSLLSLVAVHAGVLKDGEEGIVKVTFAPGQAKYNGSVRNGVESLRWSNYDLSYKIESVTYILGLNFFETLPCSYKLIVQ